MACTGSSSSPITNAHCIRPHYHPLPLQIFIGGDFIGGADNLLITESSSSPITNAHCIRTRYHPLPLQIFIGGDFIGGADNLLKLLGSPADFEKKLSGATGDAFPSSINDLVQAELAKAPAKPAGPSEEEIKANKLAEALENGLKWDTKAVRCAGSGSVARTAPAAALWLALRRQRLCCSHCAGSCSVTDTCAGSCSVTDTALTAAL